MEAGAGSNAECPPPTVHGDELPAVKSPISFEAEELAEAPPPNNVDSPNMAYFLVSHHRTPNTATTMPPVNRVPLR